MPPSFGLDDKSRKDHKRKCHGLPMRHCIQNIFIARKRSLRRLCFYTCLSVILLTGVSASVHAGIHPPEQTPPQSRHHPIADTHTRSRHPPGNRHPPELIPPGADTPSAQCMLGDTGNKRAVRILLECILVFRTFAKRLAGFSKAREMNLCDLRHDISVWMQ